jgi:hypothetical protein
MKEKIIHDFQRTPDSTQDLSSKSGFMSIPILICPFTITRRVQSHQFSVASIAGIVSTNRAFYIINFT